MSTPNPWDFSETAPTFDNPAYRFDGSVVGSGGGTGGGTGTGGGGTTPPVSTPPSPYSGPYTSLITSEHNQKPNFMAMVAAITGAFGDLTALYQSIPSVFDIDTAVGVQLDAIGQWVGQGRVIGVILTPGYFGFADNPAALTMGELNNASFNSQYAGVFYELGATYESGTTSLGDTDYRLLLKARIVRNQSNGLIGSIEAGLQYIFGAPCAIQDTGMLILNITVPVQVSTLAQALVKQLDVLPGAAGVAIGTVTFPNS